MEIVIILLLVRNLIRLYDFEKTRDTYEDPEYFYFLTNS